MDTKARVRARESLGVLEQALAEIFAEKKADEIAGQVLNSVKTKIDLFIKENYGDLPRKTTIRYNTKDIKFDEVVHEKFETILSFVHQNEPVFITGPAGSGKNVICKQISKALDLEFYFANAVTQEYKITGFTDAMGRYQESQFYKAFKDGGLFMLDEVDASIPEVLIILNAAIANRYFDFPAPIGKIEAHENFRIIAAGNTFGTGATYQYVGRNQLDAASLDRFAVIEVNYSENIEKSVCQNNTELITFCRDFREAARKAGTQTIVSYRAMGRIARMEDNLDMETLLKSSLLKNLERDDIKMIIGGLKHQNKYRSALERMVK